MNLRRSFGIGGASLASASLLLIACSSDPAHLRRSEHSVTGGSAAPNEDAVFFVETQTTQGVAVCSATLITPHLLLTAAHCVTGQFGAVDCEETVIASPLAPSAFRVINEPDLTGPADGWIFSRPDRIEIPYPGASLCGHDLALLGYETAITADVATPLPLGEPLGAQDVYRVAGYGAAHPSGTGERLRRISNELPVICRDADCAGAAIPGVAGASGSEAPHTSTGEFLGGPTGCPGDSGGPALSEGADSSDAVAGVLSRGREDCSVNVFSDANTPEVRALVRTLSAGWNAAIPPWALEPEKPVEPPSQGGAGGDTSAPSSGGSAGENNSTGHPSSSPPSGAHCQCQQSPTPTRAGVLWMLLPFLTRLRRARRHFPQQSLS